MWIDGVDITRLGEAQMAAIRNSKIGMVFQAFNLIPTLTAQENVEVPLYVGKHPGSPSARAAELLNLVGLGHRLDHQPNQLSGGEQQRVAIARALATNPAIVIADEPTGNLDQSNGQNVLDLIRRLRDETGTTFIIATHDPTVAAAAERSLQIVDGLLAADTATAGVRGRRGGAPMKARLYWSYATRSLRRGGQRTLLAIFCIGVGVMAIVALQLASLMVSNDLTGNVRASNGGDVSVRSDVIPFSHADAAYFTGLKTSGQVTAETAETDDRGIVRHGGSTLPRDRRRGRSRAVPAGRPARLHAAGARRSAYPAGRARTTPSCRPTRPTACTPRMGDTRRRQRRERPRPDLHVVGLVGGRRPDRERRRRLRAAGHLRPRVVGPAQLQRLLHDHDG